MSKNLSSIAKTNKIKYFLIRFVDLFGVLRSKLVPTRAINDMQKNVCVNSLFNGITITIDMLDDSPDKIRLFALRSFGESLYHSITDASLEFGYEAV